jgi:hypothetical protein
MVEEVLRDLNEEDQGLVENVLKQKEGKVSKFEEPRVAIRQDLLAQLPPFELDHQTELACPPDYLAKLRSSDFGFQQIKRLPLM